MDGRQGRTHLACESFRACCQLFDTAGGAGQVGVNKRAECPLPHGACNCGHEKGQFGPDARREGTKNHELRFQPCTGFGVAGRTDTPLLALRVQQKCRIEVRRIVRELNSRRSASVRGLPQLLQLPVRSVFFSRIHGRLTGAQDGDVLRRVSRSGRFTWQFPLPRGAVGRLPGAAGEAWANVNCLPESVRWVHESCGVPGSPKYSRTKQGS